MTDPAFRQPGESQRAYLRRRAAEARANREWREANPVQGPQETEAEARERSLAFRYSDAQLQKAAESGSPGPKRAAPYLLRLDTWQRRYRADSEAMTLGNLRPGRYSDDVWEAVQALERLIAAGREGEELYGERVAREDRERQNEERDFRLKIAAARVSG